MLSIFYKMASQINLYLGAESVFVELRFRVQIPSNAIQKIISYVAQRKCFIVG